jgi:DNA-binding transcriptional LysR family regulator
MRWQDRIGRRLKLRDLHVLLTVAQCGSMAKAAEQLAVSHPVVSKAVADLEHAVGVPLLERSSRGTKPTSYGEALIDRAGAAFDELRQGIRRIDFLADPMAGEVWVGTSVILAMSFTAAVIDLFSKRYPRIVVHLLAAESGMTYRALDERQVDLLVVGMFGATPEHLDGEVLYREHYRIAAGTRNPWTRRPKVTLRELMDEPWTLPTADSLTGGVVAEAFRASGLDLPRSAVVTDSIPARAALTAGGRYLTIVPDSVFRFPATQSGLKALPADLPTARRAVGIVTLKNRTISPGAQLFIDCARETAGLFAKDQAGRVDPRSRPGGDSLRP